MAPPCRLAGPGVPPPSKQGAPPTDPGAAAAAEGGAGASSGRQRAVQGRRRLAAEAGGGATGREQRRSRAGRPRAPERSGHSGGGYGSLPSSIMQLQPASRGGPPGESGGASRHPPRRPFLGPEPGGDGRCPPASREPGSLRSTSRAARTRASEVRAVVPSCLLDSRGRRRRVGRALVWGGGTAQGGSPDGDGAQSSAAAEGRIISPAGLTVQEAAAGPLAGREESAGGQGHWAVGAVGRPQGAPRLASSGLGRGGSRLDLGGGA